MAYKKPFFLSLSLSLSVTWCYLSRLQTLWWCTRMSSLWNAWWLDVIATKTSEDHRSSCQHASEIRSQQKRKIHSKRPGCCLFWNSALRLVTDWRPSSRHGRTQMTIEHHHRRVQHQACRKKIVNQSIDAFLLPRSSTTYSRTKPWTRIVIPPDNSPSLSFPS